jgi:hypothetical protein
VHFGGDWRTSRRARVSVLAFSLILVTLGLGVSAYGQAVDIPPLISPPLPVAVPSASDNSDARYNGRTYVLRRVADKTVAADGS